ncbi:MAG TPA: hypothetical protein VHM01_07405 [Alphaproteobacteria bacterium]|nr:hypothetical protein [Alphaproteobacteria bacterium]
MPLDPLDRALAGVNDPAILKQMIVALACELHQAGRNVSSGYLRLRPERPVLAPKPRVEPVTL